MLNILSSRPNVEVNVSCHSIDRLQMFFPLTSCEVFNLSFEKESYSSPNGDEIFSHVPKFNDGAHEQRIENGRDE